jgi:hypothetical protein
MQYVPCKKEKIVTFPVFCRLYAPFVVQFSTCGGKTGRCRAGTDGFAALSDPHNTRIIMKENAAPQSAADGQKGRCSATVRQPAVQEHS